MKLSEAIHSDWLVFTDLDGTLLDHHSYSAEPARASLERLRAAGIPVILTTSKTFAELGQLMLELGINGPAISENGACIHLPAGWSDDATVPTAATPGAKGLESQILRFSPPYSEIIKELNALRDWHRYQFTGFNDLSDQQVAEMTGLSPAQAHLARRRDGSEPLLWQGDQYTREQFQAELPAKGLKTLQGGRFLHVIGEQADKALALSALVDQFRERGWQGRTLALGDAPNDHGMLSVVDQPVIIHNPDAALMPRIANLRLYRSRQTGPEGWREAIDRLIPEGTN